MEVGQGGQYEEGSVLTVVRSSAADRADFPYWHRHSGSSVVLRSAVAHKLHVLTVSPGSASTANLWNSLWNESRGEPLS